MSVSLDWLKGTFAGNLLKGQINPWFLLPFFSQEDQSTGQLCIVHGQIFVRHPYILSPISQNC